MSPGSATDWDAEGYHRVSSFQEEWARRMLDERLPLQGDETVLDAGCGSGRATSLIVERLPRGRVIGVDASPAMVEHARGTLGPAVPLITSDLTDLTPAMLGAAAGVESVDAVFSNATFHWIADHGRLFLRLHELLRPGGRLVAQCGGHGNVAELERVILEVAALEPYAAHLADWQTPWNFASVADTESRLLEAGFDDVSCWVFEVEAAHEDPRAFMRASGLAPVLERLPEDLREPFVDDVFGRLEQPVVFHYVRLNIDASRPS